MPGTGEAARGRMSALFKFSTFLVLAFAVAISIYLLGSGSDEDVISDPPTQEAAIAPVIPAPPAPVPEAPVAPAAPAAQADIDDDLVDYMIARELGSLQGWRAFLIAHGSGSHAQSARAEVEKLLHAEKTPAPAAADVSHGGSQDAKAASEAAPSPATEVAPLMSYETCRRGEERVKLLRSPSSEEAARFANELRCEKLRPQLLG